VKPPLRDGILDPRSRGRTQRAPLVAAGVVLLGLALLLAARPASATSCPSPGGEPIGFPNASSDGDFVFRGRGFGHGVGLSQWGARGAAELGCTARDILTTYFAGTRLGSADTSGVIRVGIVPNAGSTASRSAYFVDPVQRINVQNVSSMPITWALSGASSQPPDQPANSTWRVVIASNGQYRLEESSGGSWHERWRGSSSNPLRAALGSGRLARLPMNDTTYGRGRLEFQRVTHQGEQRLYVTARLLSVEQYLYGLAEMPSSWHPEALAAQAIVGRSFAVARRSAGYADNCQCHIYDSTAHQVYRGHNKESEGTNAQWGRRWVAAVDASSGQVLRRSSDGALISGNYASSHGGHSESSQFVWGQSQAHQQPLDDSRWERASGNPNSQWIARFTAQELGAAFGVGTALHVRLPDPKGTSGRVGDPARGAGGLVVEGSHGTVRVSGEQARRALGLSQLRSTLFVVSNPPLVPADAVAVTGDWNGDGTTNLGWFHEGTWQLRMTDGSITTFVYGQRSGDVPVTGDWNGDDQDTVGIYRPSAGGEWHLRNGFSGRTDHVFTYGQRSGDVPVVGDWDGVGGDGVGIFRRGGEWHLRNGFSGRTDHVFTYGQRSGDVPVTGDWDRGGQDTVGIYRPSAGGEWHLRNGFSGRTDHVFTYGQRSGDVPVTGDWNGNGRDGPGIFRRGGEWHLRNSLSGSGGQTAETVTWH
jgi:SpoIID/LytB domain protein